MGQISANTIIKIMRFFPIKGGSSCYCQTVEHPYLLEKCVEVLERLNWVGFADFDVLEDIDTCGLKIIEINPRVPSSLQASVAAGVDFARIIVADEFGRQIPTYNYQIGQEVRWFGLDVMWFIFKRQISIQAIMVQVFWKEYLIPRWKHKRSYTYDCRLLGWDYKVP